MKKCKRYNIPGDAHELTFSCYNNHPFLNNHEICTRLADSIMKAKKKNNFDLWAFVFMPEHVHLLIWPKSDKYSISEILYSVKQPVSRSTILSLKKHNSEELYQMTTGKKSRPYHFWQPGGGYDRNITSTKALMNSMEYIHNNPVRRGLVRNAEEWLWSSVRCWLGIGEGPLEVDSGSFPML